jgi:hypothetical protein
VSSEGIRWWLLAEDQRHHRLALRLAVRLKLTTLIRAEVAPKGGGSAAAWVLARCNQVAARTTRKRQGQRVALIIMIDADHVGLIGRKRELDERLHRTSAEPIVFLVPAWSIETWLLGAAATTEVESLKHLYRDEKAADFEAVAARIHRLSDAEPLASVRDAHGETRRVPD